MVKVGNSGINNIKEFKGNSDIYLIAFKNGSVCIFNIAKKKAIFTTEAGHCETIFDMKFNPADKSMLATCSFDGSIRIWNSSSMSLLLHINTDKKNKGVIGHTIKQTNEGKNILYSLDWSPDGKFIACVNCKGVLKIFESTKGRLKAEI